MAEKPIEKINPDELFQTVMDKVFTPVLEPDLQVTTEEVLGTKIASIKFNLERDIFEVLARYEIPRERALGAVANFMQNLARLK